MYINNEINQWLLICNNSNLDLVNVDVHTKFDQTLSDHAQEISGKQNSDINQNDMHYHKSRYCQY